MEVGCASEANVTSTQENSPGVVLEEGTTSRRTNSRSGLLRVYNSSAVNFINEVVRQLLHVQIGNIEQILSDSSSKITLFIIPRLNADGTERWTRETALGIDMNRDASKLHSPEAKILHDWAHTINPLFSFNLHDQHRLYSVGNTPHQTHIALLATTGDESGTWTDSRLRAGKLANRLTKIVQEIYPNKIAKWTDEYNTRAFGDYFQSQGFGLILLESGGAGWDLEKQSLRKTNACLLLDAFYAIATEEWKTEEITTYQTLLTNERNIFDIKLINAPLNSNKNIRADIGLNICEEYINGKIEFSWTLEEIGDLSIYSGLTEIHAGNYELNNDYSIEKGKNYTSLQMTLNKQVAFNLTDYTNKINQTK